MIATAKRKLESELTEWDFREFPVWRFSPDAEDGEAEVEPFPAANLSFAESGTYLLTTKAVLADGSECSAFIRVGKFLTFVEEGPLTLFLNSRQCLVEASIPGWAGTKSVSAVEKKLLPIRWAAGVGAVGEQKPRTGSVSSSRFVYFFKSTIRGLRVQGTQ